MTATCTNTYRLNGVRAAVALTVVLILHASASAQVRPGRRGRVVRDPIIGSVRSGTSLTAMGTIGPGMKNVTIGMGVMKTGADLQKVQGVTGAYFTGWGELVEDGVAMRTMYVTIDQARHVQKIVIPNTEPDATSISPDPSVKKLAETLKIGDAVKFNFEIIGERIYGTKISLLKRLSTKNGPAPFVYISKKHVSTGTPKSMTVTVNAGVIPCTFRVPEEIDDKGRSRPSTKVTDALKTFCRGDLLDLEYKVVNYEFVLTGVKAARRSSQGKIVKVVSGKLKGYQHMGAKIETAKRTMTYTDPEPVIELKLKNVKTTTPDPPVQTALKTLKAGDYVIYHYRRQRGVYWLDGIYATSPPASQPPTPEAGTK
jgi:hypothetical protein